jgi:ribose-phosphate pyrophosphokinase
MVALANVGIHSIRSTHSVPHATNTFVLDDLFASALRGEFGDTAPFKIIS